MIVKYFAYYRIDAGCKEEHLLLGPATAFDLIVRLSEIHGNALKKRLLTEDGLSIHPDVIFLIDGRNIDFLSGQNSVIPKDAVVSLFPRIAGG